jgi:sporulation protein YlmC with PRC-barrel domain
MELRRIAGMTVRDTAGEDLGEITNLLIASDTGQVLYGVVSYGGFLGFGGKQVAIPWGGFVYDSASETMAVAADRATLEGAPAFSDLGSGGISQPGWDSAVRQYWQQRGMQLDTGSTGAGTGTGTGAGSATGTSVASTGTPGTTVGTPVAGTSTPAASTGTGAGTGVTGAGTPGSTTGTGTGIGATGAATGTTGTTDAGTSAGTMTAGAQLLRADRIVGMDVRGSDMDQRLGDVSDLLINVDVGQVLYALVGSGGFLGIGQTTKPVPWDAMEYSAGDNTLILNVTADELNAAPDLPVEQLPETVGEDWDASVRQFWQIRTSQ